MPRKADKFAARIDRKINGRRVRLPADISDFERAGADFVASIFALAHAENPDEDWLSQCQPHIKAAAMQKGITPNRHHELGRHREDEKDPRHQRQNAS